MYLVFNLGLNGLSWIGAYFIATSFESPLIVLHYNIRFGIDWIGEVARIYTFPIIGLSVLVINLILANLLPKRDNFWIHLLMFSNILVNLFLLLVLYSLYLVNFR